MLIQRYLAKQLLRPVLGVFVFLVIVVAVFYSAQLLGQAATDGLPVESVIAMAGLRLILYFDVLIPVAVLMGLVLGLSRVQQAHELTALEASGMSRWAMFRLTFICILALGLLVAALSMSLRPWGYGQFYKIEASLAERLDISRIEPGRFQVGDDEWLIYADRKTDDVLEDVFVYQRRPDGQGLLTAQSLTQSQESAGLIRLQFSGNVSSYTMPKSGSSDGQWLVSRFSELEVLAQVKPVAARQKIRRALTTSTLMQANRSIEVAELQWRFVTPLSVLMLAAVATVLVSRKPRSSRSTFIIAALVVVTLYFSGLGVLVNWVEQGDWPSFPGVFLMPALVILGLVMVRVFGRWRGLGA